VLRGQVIGALAIKREEAADWNEDEVVAVESVASQIALALENARLSEEQENTIVQLKDVDRLKSEFLTSMSHELRTPLNSIIGFADVLLQGIDGELNEMALNDIRLIYNSGQHLLALINDILDLSKIEAGKMELVRQPLNVADAIKEVLAASTALLKKKPVEVIVEVEESLPPIYADKLRFNQVLLNLVSNSAKFTDEGSITLEAEIYDRDPDKMLISVSDTGIGIPPDKIDAVFDRFRQADSSTTRQYGGTGLGLAICEQLVEMHGGKIWITSEAGVGSTFHFTIPLHEVTDAPTVTVEINN
jgi:signal transduction histidine kinase